MGSHEGLSERSDEGPHIAFSLKSIWSDGTYQIVLSPQELLEKLAALVPPPRLNLVRYHGVLAPNAVDRAQIVPGPIAADEAADAGENDPPPPRDATDWPGPSCWRACSSLS